MRRSIKLSEGKLRRLIREAVRRAIIEVKIDDDPYDRLSDLEATLRSFDGGVSIEGDLAEFMVDNGISIGELKRYEGIVNRIDLRKLANEIDKYKGYLESERLHDKFSEYTSWAQDRMSDMGFGFEGD